MNLIYTKSTKLLSLNFLYRIYEAAISSPEEQSRLHKMLVLFKQNCSTVFSEAVSDLSQAYASNEV